MAGMSLVQGQVMHQRLQPLRYPLRHRVDYLCLPLSQLAKADRFPLAIDRAGLLSVRAADHGPKDGTPLEDWIRNILARFEVTAADGEILLVTLPRSFGYVFNPVSFWLCLDRAGGLRAVLAEVNNTFGEAHSYLLCHPDQRVIGPEDRFTTDKCFHVSPFFFVKGTYRFRFVMQDDRLGFWIDYDTEEGPQLLTSLTGKRLPLTRPALWRSLLAMPVICGKVMLLIHWHALKLWGSGLAYLPKPQPPAMDVSR